MPDLSIEIADALGAWGIDFFTMDALGPDRPGDAAHEQWRIGEPGAPPRVLRRYAARRPSDSIPYEHDLLQFLAGHDWPVAAPIAAADGRTLVHTEYGRWSLFPLLEGAPSPRETIFQQRKGAVLALLHADMREWNAPAQRPAWGRVTDLDVPVRADGFASLDSLLHWYADVDLDRATALAGFRERNLAELDRLGYASEPDTVVYDGCLSENVLFVDNDVTGLLDFDRAHADARVADIARSLLIDCWPDGYFLHYWTAGYTAHADPRLSPAEVDLLPPLIVANEIRSTVVALSISAHDPTEERWESIRHSIDHRLLSLDATQDELRRAVRAGAGMPTR